MQAVLVRGPHRQRHAGLGRVQSMLLGSKLQMQFYQDIHAGNDFRPHDIVAAAL
jgi:hypothetical protein